MRIALIQLPLLDPGHSALNANVPLAAGYLASYLFANSRDYFPAEKPDISIAPRELVDFGGDSAILEWIGEGDFDVVGFTCYMWNVERSLWLAERIKNQNPRTVTIAGGPEIAENCSWCDNPHIDTFVIGEGEESFPECLRLISTGKRLPKLVRNVDAVNLEKITNPYVSGFLLPKVSDQLHFETMRGCRFSCTYCYYSKTRSEARLFPRERIGEFFEYAREHSPSEIYVMDPSFVSSRDIEERLKLIKAANTTRIPLHTELNLELVDETIAALLGEAGFVSIEAGLQSTNTTALKAVKRYFNEKKFIRGAMLISGQRIKIRTGIIMGLPFDTLDGFSETLDFIADNGLTDGIEIYPLSILPGTRLKQDAERFEIEYMERPPYHVLKTSTMAEEDFLECRELVSEKLGLDLFHRIVPHFSGSGKYTGFIDMDSDLAAAEAAAKPFTLANNCTIVLDEPHLRKIDSLSRIAAIFRKQNPSACIQLVVRSDNQIDDDAFSAASDLFFEPSHYIERVHSFDDDIQGKFATRVFQLTGDKRVLMSMLESDSFADPIFHYSIGKLSDVEHLLEQELPLVAVPPNIPDDEIKSIRRIYAGCPELILFEAKPDY